MLSDIAPSSRYIGTGVDFDTAWNRIKEITGWKKYVEIQRFLNIKAGSVTGAKKRKNMPLGWLYSISLHYGCSMDWLLTGKGAKYAFPAREDAPQIAENSSSYTISVNIPAEIEAVFDAFMEVMTSGVDGTVAALTQNIYESLAKVRLHKEKEIFEEEKKRLRLEVKQLRADMDAIKERLSDGGGPPGDQDTNRKSKKR